MGSASAAHVRRLTVGYVPQFRRGGECVCVPLLRVSGKWLEAAGFKTGAAVEVDVTEGQIVISAQPSALTSVAYGPATRQRRSSARS